MSIPEPEPPQFSVIVPAHGRPRWLSEAIASVLQQTVRDFEVIVVDDASPEPVEVPHDPRVRVVRREANGGPAAARNTGMEHARGAYLTFLDDDDAFAPERLAIGRQGAALGPLSVCWLRPLADEVDRVEWKHLLDNENRILDGPVGDVILDGLPPHLGQVTIAREARIPFDESLLTAEDIEWWIRAAQVLPVVTVPRIGYYKRRHDEARMNYRHQVRIDSNLQILARHADYFAAHPRAAARRWRSQAIFAGRLGDPALKKEALRRSLRLHPRASTLMALARTYAPGKRG